MKPKRILILFLIVLFTVLQCTALNYVRIFSIKPDILLILVLFLSLHCGRMYGMLTGAVCGLFSEATSAVPLGFGVFVYSFAGLTLGHIARWIYPAFLGLSEPFWLIRKDRAHPALSMDGESLQSRRGGAYRQRIFVQMGIAFVATFLIYLFLFSLFQAVSENLPLFDTLGTIILPASFYTACVTPILFLFLKEVF